MVKGIRVAVIGGGPVGAVTLKTLLRESNPGSQITARLFECQNTIGGSFHDAYENGVLVSSKQLTAFSDFRLPAECPTYMSFAYYAQYIERYCVHFKLLPYISLGTCVTGVEIRQAQKWKYRIHYSFLGKDGIVCSGNYDCSHIAVCTGLQSKPYSPDIPGLSEFRGRVLHSSDYKSLSQLINENVVIIGSGESAMDIAYAAVLAKANSVTMCFRSGFLSIPKCLDLRLFGKTWTPNISLDWLHSNLFGTAYVHPVIAKSRLRWNFSDLIMKCVLILLAGTRNQVTQKVGKLPFRSWRQVYVNRNEAIVPYLNAPYNKSAPTTDYNVDPESCKLLPISKTSWIDTCTVPSYISPDGALTFTPDRSRKDYVRMMKGPPVRASTIIFCTGYKTLGSFLPAPYSNVSRATCRNILNPNDPTVAHMCFIRSWIGSSAPLAEMQAMWYTALLDGRLSTPPTTQSYYRLPSRNAHNHPGVDFPTYLATLAGDIGALPSLWTLLWEYGWKVTLAYCLGGSFISFYRLTGPFKDKERMRKVVEDELWGTLKAKGWVGNICFGVLPIVVFGVVNAGAWVVMTLWASMSFIFMMILGVCFG